VTEYRIYVLDDGHVVTPPTIALVESDHEALFAALGIRVATAGSGVEVWCGVGLVCRVPPVDPTRLLTCGPAA
jgi:hypothetical protein